MGSYPAAAISNQRGGRVETRTDTNI